MGSPTVFGLACGSLVCLILMTSQVHGQIDELIANAAETSDAFDFFSVLPANGSTNPDDCMIKMELDIMYSCEEWDYLQSLKNNGTEAAAGRKKRTAGIRPGAHGGQRWTSNKLYYFYASGHFSSSNMATIRSAHKHWSDHTCLTFHHSTSARNKIRYQNSGGCHSRVGMVGGTQVVGLASGCRVRSVVTHELGHAIGLHHEQTRPDRDEHVWILKQNIPNSVVYNFDKYTWSVIQKMGLPYDYSSIMHYGKTAFSRNRGLTIQTKDSRYQNVIGQRQGLSFYDVKAVNIMYNCGGRCGNKKCPSPGFVNKDCKCMCPGSGPGYPTKECAGGGGGGGSTGSWGSWGGWSGCSVTCGGGTKSRKRSCNGGTGCRGSSSENKNCNTRACSTSSCNDMHTSCASWARSRECTKNPNYMLVYCKKSCGRCGGGSSCNDNNRYCGSWKNSGYCNAAKYRAYMSKNCKKSCGKCGSASEPIDTGACEDLHAHCASWAAAGECQKNPAYMNINCQVSCSRCQGAAAPVPVTTTAAAAACVDNSSSCTYWAGIGECRNNPLYMNINCRASCRLCQQTFSSAVVTCSDSNQHCASWASNGECARNPAFMREACRSSCGVC